MITKIVIKITITMIINHKKNVGKAGIKRENGRNLRNNRGIIMEYIIVQ